jgi:soluble lytic murein transglycosylase
MLPEQARQAAAGSSLSANPSAVAGISAWSELMERPRWDPALPLTSKEALARHIASALGSGKCQTTPLYEPGHLTERGQANAARCALWNHSIPQAIAYWEALSNAKPDEARWRAMLAIARGSPASSGFASTSYFQLLSNVAWGARAPGAEPASPDAKPTVSAGPAATCQDGGAELALSLWAHGVRKESADAWRELLERSDTATRACLGQRADALGAHALRIAAFAGSTYDERAYKPGFEKIIASAAERQGLDVDLWSSVARQESRYDETAMSRSGALGLFQMMPVTAREVALQAKVEPLSSASLLQAQPNAELAAYHFSKLLAQFKDDVPWSLCAYNAGPGRCKGWRSALSDLPMALRIEAIPYDETRVYIERILAGWSLSSSPDPRRASFLADGLPKAKADSPSAAPTIKKIKKLRHSKVKISH